MRSLWPNRSLAPRLALTAWLLLGPAIFGQDDRSARIGLDDPQPVDRFGLSVAFTSTEQLLSGSYLDDRAALDGGAVTVFDFADGGWRIRQTLFDPEPGPIDEFGFALDVAGDRVLIGIEDDRDARGGATLFTNTANGWIATDDLLPRAAKPEDSAGVAVALDGSTAVLGSLRNDPDGGVWIFEEGPDGFTETVLLTPPREGERFGQSVEVQGQLLAVGAPEAVDGGAVYLYERRSIDDWRQVARVAPGSPSARFGFAILLDGDDLYVGAPTDNRHAVGGGAVYRIAPGDGSWSTITPIGPPEVFSIGSQGGFALAFDDPLLVIGSPASRTGGPAEGEFHVLRRSGDRFRLLRSIIAEPSAAARLGVAVDVRDGMVAAGAPFGRQAGVEEAGFVVIADFRQALDRCPPGDDILCFHDDRFTVEVTWTKTDGSTGSGHPVRDGQSSDSGLFWFFEPDNWELLVKVVDGCPINGHYWLFAAATTDLGLTLRVTDTWTGVTRQATNTPGEPAPALVDTSAFAACSPP